MRETQVARRYALALFKTGLDSGNLDIIAADIHQLRSLAIKNKSFIKFLGAPQVPTEQKVDVLRGLFTTRLAPRLLLFLELLLEKHRIGLLSDIVYQFEKLVEDYKGLIRARVVTSIYLTDEEKVRLKEKLEKISNKKIDIVHKIDNSIIGGMIVYLHNIVIDRSIKRQLEVLKHDLLKVKVY